MALFPPEWFHGLPLRLTLLKARSTVAPVYDLTRVISHKPGLFSLVSMDDEGGGLRLEHDGVPDDWLWQRAGGSR